MSLVAKNIAFCYPNEKKDVLKDFSIYFEQGEITAITGSNGCGKTTLTKILIGILKPSSGRVILDGQDIKKLSLTEIGNHIGYVMQNPSQQLFCTSVEEEMAYGLHNQNLSKKEIEELTDYYLSYFQLSHHKKSFPFHLSQGEKQRLVLAAILAMKPNYVILDEPTANLDIYRSKLLGKYLQKIKEELNCGVIIVSHDERFVKDYCERIVTMTGDKIYE